MFKWIPLLSVFIGQVALAGEVEILHAQATRNGDTWRFDVTLRHADTGWDHYADGWEVLTPQGESLGLRVLAHPHVNEQPFTRSLGSVTVPEGLAEVVIRARDNVDGWSSQTYRLPLP